jgi:hypothetical protein
VRRRIGGLGIMGAVSPAAEKMEEEKERRRGNY